MSAPPALPALRRRARAVLLVERAWPALWPAIGVAGALICAALLGLITPFAPLAHATLVGLALLAVAWLGWRGLRDLRLPDDSEADRRLERASGLGHRPLGVLADTLAPGAGDPALWQAHRARTLAGLGRLRSGWPAPGMARRDGMALRHLLLLGLAAGLVVAGGDAPRRLLGLLVIDLPPAPPAMAPRLDVWLAPPAFTGEAPSLLVAGKPDVAAPAGSKLTATLSGGSGSPEMRLAGAAVPFQGIDARSWQATAELRGGGRLEVRAGGAVIGAWELTVVADVPPSVQWTAPPDVVRGRVPQTRLSWQVAHPYGVGELRAELRLSARPEAAPLALDIPLPGRTPRAAKGVRLADLTASPWAGLPVTARLVARDTGGMEGTSETRPLILPERAFVRAAARALVAARKQIALAPDDRARPLAALDALAAEAGLWDGDAGGYLNLHVARTDLAAAPRGSAGDTAIDSVQDRLWQLALHLEEESPARTAERLAQARRELKEALAAARASPPEQQARKQQELRQREQAVRDALRNHMQALRRDAQRDAGAPPPEALAQRAEKALDAMRDATDEGRQDDAEQREADLEESLDALEQARREAAETPRQKKRAEGRQKGRQQMGVAQDLIRRERTLVDHAQARAQDGTEPDSPDPQAPAAGPPPPSLAEADAAARAKDTRVQRALRRALGQMMQNYGDLTGQVPTFLGDADQAMRSAAEALAAGQDDAAAEAARKAVQALQEGSQAMSRQLAQQFGRERGQQPSPGQDGQGDQADEGDATSAGEGAQPGDEELGQQGDSRQGRSRDPFGRALHEGENGATDGADTAVPETVEQARARAVQEELRRRGADRTRPEHELDYIRRLLDTP